MKNVVTSVRIRDVTRNEYGKPKKMPVWMYECVTYLKGFPDKIVFQSALYHNRDGAVSEIRQFLQNNIEFINEWVN